MRRAMVLTLALLLGASAWATTYRQLTLPEMLDLTEIAFLGTVNSQRVEERLGEPWTVVEFEVERALAGVTAGSRVELAFLGGDLPTGGVRVELMPTFETGEQVLLLAYDEEFISPVVGFNQGLWRLTDTGLRDALDRRLGLDDEGRLAFDGVEADPDLVMDAIQRELEAAP